MRSSRCVPFIPLFTRSAEHLFQARRHAEETVVNHTNVTPDHVELTCGLRREAGVTQVNAH